MNKLRGFLCQSTWLGLVLISSNTVRADFNPVPLASDSFNQDIVVERTAPSAIGRATSASMDAGTNNTDASWYEIGYNTTAPTTGLPPAGSTFSSASLANHQFAMAPTYATNNAMLIDGIVTNGTWLLTSPAAYTNLSFLTSGGHNGRTIGVLIHHQDGTVERGSFSSPDWFNGVSPAYTSNGRLNVQTFLFDSVNSGNPRLYSRDIPLTNKTSPVISIDLTNASLAGGNVGVFAVSGTTPTSATWTPIPVSGYNADMIVEVGAPQPVPLTSATTATMANGTANTGATWFESGYDPFLPTNGLPAAGSTVTSANQSDHHYKLPASYSANNAALLDATLSSAQLIPSVPASFSALSFLASSANGDASINFTLQHQDGSTESGSFTVPNWFNSSPVAYMVNGSFLLDNRALTNENATPLNPRLYEPQIALANTVSPVTNVSLSYAGGAAGSRAAFFAMSGSAGAVPPIISASPQSVITYEGPNETFSATVSGGTPPLSYRWQKGTNGVFANLSDGGNISGAATTSLTVNTVGLSDSADYRLVVSNVVGAVNSGVANLLVLSSLPDITSPGDPITAVGGTSPVGEEVTHAIDDDTAKYLNFGGGTTPFSGTAGFVVTPAFGRSVVSVMRIYTANDFPDRDPADYLLEGSDDGNTFTPIASGPVSLPTERNAPGNPPDPTVQPMTQVSFSNLISYTSYRLTFSHVKNPAGANSCQIGEVELLGVAANLAIDVSPSFINLYSDTGGSAQFNANVSPIDPSTSYQWQKLTPGGYVSLVDNTKISGSQTATLSINNVSFNDAGNYILVVSNSTTIASSISVLLNVLSTLNDVTVPTDPITIYNGSSPAAEVVTHALDNVTDKYLNYGNSGTQLAPFVGPAGFVVTPSLGSTLVTAVRIYTANDAPERDPAGFKLEGSNDGGSSYSLITSNSLSLPPDRNPAGLTLSPLDQPNQEIRFSNSRLYTTYRLSVAHVKNDSAANSVQFAEAELLGSVVPVISITNSGGNISISTTIAGHLQSATNIGSPIWLDAGPISGTVIVSPLPSEPKKFYRVVVP